MWLFKKKTQKIELFSRKNDSKNWTFVEHDSNWFFLSVTQRIEFFEYESKNRTHFLCEKNWIFLSVTQRIDFLSFFFLKKTLKELSFSQKYYTKNWIFFQYDSKIFEKMTHRLEPFLSNIVSKKNTQRIDPFFSRSLSKCKNFWSTNTTHRTDFFFNTTHRIEFFFWKWLFFSTLNFFFEYDSKKRNSPIRLRGFHFFSLIWLKVLNFFVWLSELNFFFKKYDLTHRIEPLFMNLFSRWLKELKSFSDSKNWTFLVCQCDSKNWNLFSQNVSKNLTFLSCEFFFYMTQRT